MAWSLVQRSSTLCLIVYDKETSMQRRTRLVVGCSTIRGKKYIRIVFMVGLWCWTFGFCCHSYSLLFAFHWMFYSARTCLKIVVHITHHDLIWILTFLVSFLSVKNVLLLFSLLSLKRKLRLMQLPFCLSACVRLITLNQLIDLYENK
jgi:hypothetical protein